jgi:putative ABC transport system ATP-binding protein
VPDRPPSPVLEVRGVSRSYRRGASEVHALRAASFIVASGGSVAIMGPSGSGKTTLLNVIAGLDVPTMGDVFVAGQRLRDLDPDAATAFRRRHIGFVFQFFNLLPTMSARDNVALPLMAERLPRRDVEARTTEMLEAVGLVQRADHRPSELSGGEQQRVAIARALAMRPQLLLADEPTGNLDSAAGDETLTLLRRANESFGLSIVMVTHSYTAAAAMHRVLVIRDGLIAEGVKSAAGAPPVPETARLRLVPPRKGE